jgi:phospho-N-acetylmuramoyl-pentapeptide-transferase
MLVAIAIYSGGIIDGIDGLAGGVFMIIFSAYAGIAFYQQQLDLAALSGVIAGSLMAFLWFNIPPARFYLSETGTMGLTIVLTVIAFTTDKLGGGHGVLVLPLIAFLLVITALSAIIQIGSKRLRGGKKVFVVAPLHNHFQAIGWPGYKVTMRYWIVGIIFALLGLIIAIMGK